jgi:CheY-like chemotaxis protein
MNEPRKLALNSLLIVDDDAESLKLYTHLLNEKLDSHIISIRHPSAALKAAHKSLFDCILIDVTIDYNGTPFGGLELYKELLKRYGSDSLAVYSKYITDDLLKRYEYNFNFIERGEDALAFIEESCTQLASLRSRQSCFVAMPFAAQYESLFGSIKDAVETCGYRCVRIDQQTFTRSILEQIFQEIENAKLVVFVATDRTPNAFYEAGFAVALKKEVITVTDEYANLPFDIRDRSAIAYGSDTRSVTTQLKSKIAALTRLDAVK